MVNCFRYRLLERATLDIYLPSIGSGTDEWDGKKETVDDNYNHTLRASLESTGKSFDGSYNHTLREVNGLGQHIFACALRMKAGVLAIGVSHLQTLWPRSGG